MEGVATRLILLQHHEIEVAYTLFSILTHTFEEGWLADHIPNVFINEGIPEYRA